ncbi:MAG: Cof-type HAD-IIB family hydrolase [Eubacteriales bacterium]|nr:Cof-type HAD-IIB family hydrolase [Eubacteriales bacterium]
MLRLIALDLDGTLLHTDKGLTDRTRNILTAYMRQGTHIVVASGRSYASLPHDVMAVPGIEYVITSNGVAVCRKSTGKKLFHTPLQPDCVRQLLQLLAETDAVFELFVDGVPYANLDYVQNPTKYGASSHAIPYIQRTRKPVSDLTAFAQEHIQELDCIDLITASPEEKQQLLQLLRDIPGLYITSSVPYLVEISDAAAGKGAAVRKLAAYLGIMPEEIAAFGNAENDMDMMAFAGIGVAVANSPQHVRAAADYVTLSNDEDGVAVFLETLLYGKPLV